MSRPSSFYLETGEWREPFVLSGAEASHLSRVLRIGAGAVVRLFDGCGTEGLFQVVTARKNKVELAPQSITTAPAPDCQAYLAAGWNKSSRRGWLLEKSVEFQAAGLIFWQAARSQGKVPAEPKDSWRDALIAGAKQSGAPRLPELSVCPGGPAELIAATNDFTRRFLLWEAPNLPRLAPADLSAPGKTLLAAGPEGGLTDAEAKLFMDAGFTPVSLGDGVLRWETAALLALGLAFWARPKQKTACLGDSV